MLNICNLILLSTLFTFVYGAVFDWLEFSPFGGDEKTSVDLFNLKRTKYGPLHYLSGTITFGEAVDDTYKVRFLIKCEDAETGDFKKVDGIPTRLLGGCEFVQKYLPKYLLPLAEHHNDFPQRDSWCPVGPAKYNVFQVDNATQLRAPTELPPGDCKVLVKFHDPDKKTIGGYNAKIKVYA